MTTRRAVLMAMTIAAVARVAAAADVDRGRIDAWLRDLADADPAVRDAARMELKGLRDTDLPRLRDALVAASPLRPAQAEAMHDIVTYVLTRAAAMRLPAGAVFSEQGFLGVTMRGRILPGEVDIDIDFSDDESDPPGVAVVRWLPGFVAARVLEEGDLILGFVVKHRWLYAQPRLRLTDFGPDEVWVRSQRKLRNFVRHLRPDTPVTLLVERAGRTLSIPVKLDARPNFILATPEGESAMLNAQNQEAVATAEDAFIEQFGNVLGLELP